MHANEAVVLGCTDCHGGDANIFTPPGETYSADDHHDEVAGVHALVADRGFEQLAMALDPLREVEWAR
jgi:hypothetical protein